MRIASGIQRVFAWEYIWLCLVVAATLGMHFVIIGRPSEPMFDEKHYVTDARNIIENQETLRSEHPPLAKLFIISGIKLFGDNPWGWRFFSVMFGTVLIVLFFFLCRQLNMSPTAVSIATFLLALETMTFGAASVAMLDVYSVVFVVASFLLYASRKHAASGAAMGLSGLAKFTSVLALPTMMIHWLLTRSGRSRRFALVVFLAPVVFLGLMPLFDLAIVGRLSSLESPLRRFQSMWNSGTNLVFANVTHPDKTRPWEWLISYTQIGSSWTEPYYTAAISYSVWALAIPTFAYLIYKAVKRDEAGLFGAAWFASTYLAWIPISLITQRVSYVYYFYPTIGAICLGLGLGLSQLLAVYRQRRSGWLKWTALATVILVLIAHVASFVLLSPVFLAMQGS